MNFPCPHCGGKDSLANRDPGEIKPVVPLNQQDQYESFPIPESTLSSISTSDLERLSDSVKEQQIQQPMAIEHELEGPPSISSSKSRGTTHEGTLIKPTIDTAINTRFEKVESTLTTIEDVTKALSLDMKRVMNSLKAIEGILSKMSNELFRLREK